MMISVCFCEPASQLLQLLFYLRPRGALSINVAKRSALCVGRS